MKDMLCKKVVDLKPSGIRKFFDIVNEMPDAISLGVGEPDFDTPWHICDEGIYSLEKGKTFYTSNSGLLELRTEICRLYARKYDVSFDPKTECLITVGGSEGIDLALRAIINPGDEVIIPEPCYVSYVPCAILAGGTPVTISLKNENSFKLTRDELEAAITEKTKVLILSYPNNPTGAIMTREDLIPIAELCVEKDILVISDLFRTYLRRRTALQYRKSSRNAGQNYYRKWFLQGLCHDRLEAGLRHGSGNNRKRNDEDSSVRYHVCTDHQSVRSYKCHKGRRQGYRQNERIL